MNNKEELLKLQRGWELETVRRDSIKQLAADTLPEASDTSMVESTYTGYTSLSEMPKISGIIEGSFLDYYGKGLMMSGEANIARAHGTIEASKAAVEGLEPLVEEVKSVTGQMLTGDYQRSVIASTVGAPVDMANSLLILLGIEMSDKPFMGSRHIKESLDYISSDPYSTKYMAR
jgi:hypothetical protein